MNERKGGSAKLARSSRLSIIRILLHVFLLVLHAKVHTVSSQPTKQNHTAYEWEDLNHYEILELSEYLNKKTEAAAAASEDMPSEARQAERSAVETNDVRKAYIKQAMVHHPDKVANRDNSSKRRQKNERRLDGYAANLKVKRCKSDNECIVEQGECCIKYHFWFCGNLDNYPAKALRCAGTI